MAYAGGSLQDRLLAVQQSIGRCLDAESYSVSGRSKQSARLESLFKLENDLERRIAEVSGDYGFVLNQIDDPTSV